MVELKGIKGVMDKVKTLSMVEAKGIKGVLDKVKILSFG